MFPRIHGNISVFVAIGPAGDKTWSLFSWRKLTHCLSRSVPAILDAEFENKIKRYMFALFPVKFP